MPGMHRWGEGVRVRPSPQKRTVWALICALHTRCLIIWPQENYFQILANQKLGEAPIIYDTHQCHLFSKRKCFAENPKMG